MNINIINKSDEIIISLVHYFITTENYTPIVVRGANDEVWLEKLDGPFRIIRISSNHIHNKEQYEYDLFKTQKVMEQIKKKTFSLNMNVLNILLDVDEEVSLNKKNKNISSIKIENINELVKNKNIKEIFPMMKEKVITDKEGLDLIVNVTNDINAKNAHNNEVFSKIFEPKKPIITYILIGICVLLFISMYIFGHGSESISTLKMFGANDKSLVLSGQVWRLLTCIFLHAGIIHLVCNMYSLYIIGHQLEGVLGKKKFIAVYLGSGIIGSLFSIVFQNDISVGASGAIFGLLGSLVYFGYHYRLYLGSVLKTQIIPVIILNLFIGFGLSGIDNFAHIGGLIAGYLLTMALGIPGKEKKSDQINGSIVLILLIAFLIFVLMRF